MWKQPKRPATGECINELWSIRKMESSLVVRRINHQHTTVTWINLRTSLLNERRQTRKDRPLSDSIQLQLENARKSTATESRSVVAWGRGGGTRPKGKGEILGVMDMFVLAIAVMVTDVSMLHKIHILNMHGLLYVSPAQHDQVLLAGPRGHCPHHLCSASGANPP